MSNASLMLVGPPSPIRDRYELAVRRRGTPIQVCDDCEQACAVLANMPAQAVLMIGIDDDDVADEFLTHLRVQFARLPVFLTRSGEQRNLGRLLGEQRVVLLPAAMPPETLGSLFPPPPVHIEPTTQPASHARAPLEVHRTVYTFCFREARGEFEREYLARALERFHGNISRTAEALSMARRNLQQKIGDLQIDVSKIREESTGI